MHIHNHKEDCQYRFAFKYTSNISCTCGEEMDNELAGKGVSGATAFVNNGLRIEAEMCIAEIRFIYLILMLISYQALYCKTHCNWGSVIHTTEKNNKGSHETPM